MYRHRHSWHSWHTSKMLPKVNWQIQNVKQCTCTLQRNRFSSIRGFHDPAADVEFLSVPPLTSAGRSFSSGCVLVHNRLSGRARLASWYTVAVHPPITGFFIFFFFPHARGQNQPLQSPYITHRIRCAYLVVIHNDACFYAMCEPRWNILSAVASASFRLTREIITYRHIVAMHVVDINWSRTISIATRLHGSFRMQHRRIDIGINRHTRFTVFRAYVVRRSEQTLHDTYSIRLWATHH